jgi:hypothetical protein
MNISGTPTEGKIKNVRERIKNGLHRRDGPPDTIWISYDGRIQRVVSL